MEPNFPVGVVQLGPWRESEKAGDRPEETRDIGNLFPLLRWHQTGDYGYLPHPGQENMFLALALDTFWRDDKGEGSIHPRNKQLPAWRLAVAALRVAYNMTQCPTRGPHPAEIRITDTAEITAEITYDQKSISYRPGENSGLYNIPGWFKRYLNQSTETYVCTL